MTFEQGIAYETEAQGVLLSSADAAEALDAFLTQASRQVRGSLKRRRRLTETGQTAL